MTDTRTTGTTARELATARLAGQARRFPDLSIAPIATSGLAARDAALARAIDHAATRHWLALTAVLQSRLRRSWSSLQPQIQGPLLAGAAQMLLLDRLPDHAVIHEAVAWTRANIPARAAQAGGLVNAVLRRVAELRVRLMEAGQWSVGPPEALAGDLLPRHDGRAWKLAEPVFDAEPATSRLARQTSHPAALLGHLAADLGRAAAARVAMHDLVHPPIIVCGLPDDVPETIAHDERGFHVFTGSHHALLELLARHPSARVQDPASADAVAASASLEPGTIIDVCAGKGTKTRQLLQLHPAARLIATDTDDRRRETLQRTLGGESRVEVIDPSELIDFAGRGDLVVLDVPCSNTGVLARRVEARYRFSARSLEQLVAVQRQIIADAVALLSDPGRLLYATCSLLSAENEAQAEWVTRWHPLRMIASSRRRPRGQPGDPPQRYADGGYRALLGRA